MMVLNFYQHSMQNHYQADFNLRPASMMENPAFLPQYSHVCKSWWTENESAEEDTIFLCFTVIMEGHITAWTKAEKSTRRQQQMFKVWLDEWTQNLTQINTLNNTVLQELIIGQYLWVHFRLLTLLQIQHSLVDH